MTKKSKLNEILKVQSDFVIEYDIYQNLKEELEQLNEMEEENNQIKELKKKHQRND